jgi:hypothetical protein
MEGIMAAILDHSLGEVAFLVALGVFVSLALNKKG